MRPVPKSADPIQIECEFSTTRVPMLVKGMEEFKALKTDHFIPSKENNPTSEATHIVPEESNSIASADVPVKPSVAVSFLQAVPSKLASPKLIIPIHSVP